MKWGIAAFAAVLALSLFTAPADAKRKRQIEKTSYGPTCIVTDRNPCSSMSGGPFSGVSFSVAHGSSDRHAMSNQVAIAAAANGVPVGIAQAVIRQESGYNPNLRGRAGEWGMGQIKCQTARGVGFTGHCAALRDPATNLTYSMRYLREALAKGGSGCAGVSLYQSGTGAKPHCSRYG